MSISTTTAPMKYVLIIIGEVAQLVNVQLAQMSLPTTKQTPITAIAVVAPEKMAIKPTMEYQAATVDIANAVSNVRRPKYI